MIKAILAAVILATSTIACAQEPPPAALTVGDVINVWSGINSLDSRTTGQLDRNGAPVMMPNGFKFSGSVHLALARNSAKGLVVYNAYQKALVGLREQLSSGVPKDKLGPQGVPADREDEMRAENIKMLEAPASVTLVHIKESELCLEAAPPACPQRNDIPITTVSLLLPILDK